MDNKKILGFGTIAAVVLIVLFGITVRTTAAMVPNLRIFLLSIG